MDNGRKPAIPVTLGQCYIIQNILVVSVDLTKYRLVGGLTEGNVQLTISMISDISKPEEKTRRLAMVGICFATAFTVGPPFGAWLTTFDSGEYVFKTTALFSFGLIVLETVILGLYLPETLEFSKSETKGEIVDRQVSNIKVNESKREQVYLNILHFVYLFCFSGMEYTITFLTFDRFNYTNVQQGYNY